MAGPEVWCWKVEQVWKDSQKTWHSATVRLATVKMLVSGSGWQEERKTSWQGEEAREAGTSRRRSAVEDLIVVTGDWLGWTLL